MESIIKYDESIKNAFITLSNEIKVVDNHLEYAIEYCSHLTSSDLILYKNWITLAKKYNNNMDLDFIVLVLSFDKLHTNISNNITTTSFQPHIKYYNYYLMDYYIDLRNKLIYDNGVFKEVNREDYIIKTEQDREVEDEINDIKRKVKKEDRIYFMR